VAEHRFADGVRNAPAERWDAVAAARARFEPPGYVVHPATKDERGVIHMGWTELSEPVSALVAALSQLEAVTPAVPWMDWSATHFQETISALALATLDDVVALTTTIVRSDRFVDGAIASALDSGQFLAVVDRLLVLRPIGS
jgi:hypothetical protein